MKEFQPGGFDPLTGLPVRKTPPAINTRTMLYHETRPEIVVEGKGETDAEKRADVARQIKEKQEEGYSLTRFHGQHPHSLDTQRVEYQKRAAQKGDKYAREALQVKGVLPNPEGKKDKGA